MSDLEDFLRHVPEDGTAIGNATLQRLLKWPEKKYLEVREQLLAKGQVFKSAGRGGAIRRSGAVKDDERLLALLPVDGSTIGKTRLLEKLGWDEDRYFAARDRLVDTGKVVRGVGRGGTLRLAETPIDAPVAMPAQPDARSNRRPPVSDAERAPDNREERYYKALAETLRTQWAKDRSFTRVEVEITAKQGRRDTGGRWSRPDLTAVSLTRYRYIPGVFLDVTTFEVKTIEALDVTGVYEALAHRRSATRAYLLCVADGPLTDGQKERIIPVEEEAARHGIGLFVIDNVRDHETWTERCEARRFDADPEKLNDFIARQLSGELQQNILEWLRG
ncbi:hypothetical protein [Polyangium sp. 15x6]|uniref:hypothetical protein n=1 Tax=Polyangium sp. 15x6 TaxID=3042687 RepID=UPI00249B09D3|nr:hypothetical protein [Polyangium sp. 15x6]MDI3283010.1 hypothetical protein [Polyangium sp. 15x6]